MDERSARIVNLITSTSTAEMKLVESCFTEHLFNVHVFVENLHVLIEIIVALSLKMSLYRLFRNVVWLKSHQNASMN